MALTVTIWHNPRCSKSRAALALLQEAGIEPVIRRYLEDPPTAEEIARVLTLLGGAAIDLVRTGETEFRESDLTPSSDDGALIAAMVRHPRLIERPVVIKGDRAAIGRPPEAVRNIL